MPRKSRIPWLDYRPSSILCQFVPPICSLSAFVESRQQAFVLNPNLINLGIAWNSPPRQNLPSKPFAGLRCSPPGRKSSPPARNSMARCRLTEDVKMDCFLFADDTPGGMSLNGYAVKLLGLLVPPFRPPTITRAASPSKTPDLSTTCTSSVPESSAATRARK